MSRDPALAILLALYSSSRDRSRELANRPTTPDEGGRPPFVGRIAADELAGASGFGEVAVQGILDLLAEEGLVQSDARTPRRYSLSDGAVFGMHHLIACSPEYHTAVQPAVAISPPGTFGTWRRFQHVVAVPGSTLIVGDHAAIFGSPAAVLPLPLYLHIGFDFDLEAGAPRTEVSLNHVRVWAPSPQMSFQELAGLSPSASIPRSLTEQDIGDLRDCLQLFFKQLQHRSGGRRRIKDYKLWISSQIPRGCGLGSSGAIASALSILLEVTTGNDPFDLEELSTDLKAGASNPRTLAVLKTAHSLESLVQRRSSGVAPFASLAGTSNMAPLYYLAQGDPSSEILRDSEGTEQTYRTIETITSIDSREMIPSAAEWWASNAAVADVFTLYTRHTSAILGPTATKGGKFGVKWDEAVPAMSLMASKFWENIERRDVHFPDVLSTVQNYRALEQGFLKDMVPAYDGCKIAAPLTAHFGAFGIAAKYSGAGKGGDLVLLGERSAMKSALIPDYFPVHFSSTDVKGQWVAKPYCWSGGAKGRS